jgi:hypothetical protein
VIVRYNLYSTGDARKEVKFALQEGKEDETKFRLVKAGKRKVIELTQGQGSKFKGLYLLGQDTLTICFPTAGRKLPKKLPSSPKAGFVRLVLERAKK